MRHLIGHLPRCLGVIYARTILDIGCYFIIVDGY